MTVIYHPKMRMRLVSTFRAHKKKPREAVARLRAVFHGDESKLLEFVSTANLIRREYVER